MIKQITTGIILIILLVLITNPMSFWMPDMAHVTILICAVILFGVFASFILREKPVDERDDTHRMLAGRNAFLTGAAVLVIGIIYQKFSGTGEVDIWLIVTLVVMILAKISSRLYSDSNL